MQPTGQSTSPTSRTTVFAIYDQGRVPMEFRVFVEPQQGAGYADQLAVAQSAEQLGFAAFFRSDHYLAMSGDGLPGPTDSWVTLGAIARETAGIRLGTLVSSATFR
jgi:alkanesulfonate monooxygenase SsuD/methylene tetrahydromethanopterin reductase-like flavin-dependent oxidoreductase (luciferase family)